MPGIREKIARAVMGSKWPQPTSADTTSQGVGTADFDSIMMPFLRLSTKRLDVYNDVREMDETVEEVATGLDMLADNSVQPDAGRQESFQIVYDEGSHVDTNVKALVDGVVDRTLVREKMYSLVREMLLYGDNFLQYVVDRDLNVVRLMYMPPESMNRNEDPQGLLLPGNTPGMWAFEQVHPRTNMLIAGFYPWQIEHLRWGRSGRDPYGRSLLFTARTAWRKLQAMEEALVINWVTRAFARLLFMLDVTGKTDDEARKAIEAFRRNLQVRKISAGQEGPEALSVVKDIFMGRSYREMAGKAYEGLTDVKVLDTSSTAYTNMTAVDYYRSKLLMAVRTPKAYLGLEEDINAKATLTQEDRRYARFLCRIQEVAGQSLVHLIYLQLALQGYDPERVGFQIQWPMPVWSDIVDDSVAQKNYADADEKYLPMGVVDKEYIAIRHLGMPPSEWQGIRERLQQQPKPQEPGGTDVPAIH